MISNILKCEIKKNRFRESKSPITVVKFTYIKSKISIIQAYFETGFFKKLSKVKPRIEKNTMVINNMYVDFAVNLTISAMECRCWYLRNSCQLAVDKPSQVWKVVGYRHLICFTCVKIC